MSLTGYNPYTYTRGFRNGEQHLAVLSVSGTWHTLYLDGVQVAQNLSGGNVFATYPSITNTVVGAQANLTQAFQGTIGDVRVYNYAISSNQVSSLYLDRNLVVHYPFDNSVNSLTPNYATLSYDASMVGTPLITTSTNAAIGSGALSLTNTAGVPATQNIYAVPFGGQVTSLRLDPNAGLTIGCWINTTGISNRIMRIFDLPMSAGQKGLSVDISGTNMIYSGWKPPPFTDLTTITGLKLWLDANATSTFTTSGNNVTWADRSGSGNNATCTNTAQSILQQSTRNGYNTINFNCTGNGSAVIDLRIANTILSYPYTIFIVYYASNVTNTGGIILFSPFYYNSSSYGIGSSYNTYTFTSSSTNNIGIENAGGSTPNRVSYTYPATQFTLFTLRVNSSTSHFTARMNGTNSINNDTAMGTNTGTVVGYPGISNNANPFSVQLRPTSTSSIFNLSEYALYNAELSLANVQKVEGYLAWKYGINSSLPANHPYYGAAP